MAKQDRGQKSGRLQRSGASSKAASKSKACSAKPSQEVPAAKAFRTPTTREEQLIAAYYTVLPTPVFEKLFDRKETFVRNRRNWLGLKLPKDVMTKFTSLEELPQLDLLSASELVIVRRVWNCLRGVTSTDPDEQHRIDLLVHFSAVLPGNVLARLLGITLGGVQARQRRLKLTRSPKAGAKLRRDFAALDAAPEYEQLSAEENGIIAQAWKELRDFERTPKRVRQDAVLTQLSDAIPCAAFSAWFGISQGAIVFRRRTRGIVLSKNPRSVLQTFRKAQALPLSDEELALLRPRERAKLERIWRSMHSEYLKERRAEFAKREKALLTRLQLRTREFLRSHSEDELSACSHSECSYRWPREALFFNSNWRSPDKLGHRCSVCILRRELSTERRKTASPVRLDGKTLERAKVIVEALGAIVPLNFLTKLIGVHQTPIKRLRQEAGIRPQAGVHQDLLVWWASSETPPRSTQLLPAELRCLESVWEQHKKGFWERIEDDGGYLDLMRQERDVLAQSPKGVTFLTCHGHYCKGAEDWPDAHFFFCGAHRGTVTEPICRACYYWQIRSRNVQKRFAAIEATALGARLRGE